MSKLPGPYQPLDGGEGRRVDDPPPYSELDPSSITTTHSTAPLNLPEVPQIGFVMDNTDNMLRVRGPGSVASTTDDNNIEVPVVVTRGVPLASKSIDVVCPHCKVDIRTSIEKKPGVLAYLSGLCLCFCCLCFLPFCIEGCMQVRHTCPVCNKFIGQYRL